MPTLPDASASLIVNVEGAGAVTAIESGTDCVCAGLPASVTIAVKFAVPLALGVPEITPVAEASERPAGRLPAVIDQPYGVVPPPACSEVEYVVPFVPDGKLDVVIANAVGPEATIAIESFADLVCAGLDESATEKVKVAVPLAVGVPEITPVDVFRPSPAGIFPETKDQV